MSLMCSMLAGEFRSSLMAAYCSAVRSSARLGEISRQLFAFGVAGEESARSASCSRSKATTLDRLAALDFRRRSASKRGGDVDAVEHIADVVEHTGGDLRHARQAGDFDQLLVSCFELGFGFLEGRDVLGDAKRADDLAVLVTAKAICWSAPR